MAEKADLVINHLSELYKYKALVATAYHRGSVDKSDDPDNGRGLYRLNQARILVPYHEGTYRLATSLVKHLDEVLQIERLYAVVGANVAELAERLLDIANLVAHAVLEARTDDADRYIDEFDRAVFELADSVTGALQYLRILADNNFANVSTYAEKRRQNEYYLERVERISQALGALQSNNLIHVLESTPEGERLLETYRSQIANHLSEWRAQLLDVTAILRDYLFRTRQIEVIARRMRAFEHFLRRTPSYVPADLEVDNEVPSWARYATGFPLAAHACMQETAHDEILLDIARTIPAVTPPAFAPPRLGTLLPDTPVTLDDTEDQTKPWQIAMATLIESAGAAPISALEWKAARPELTSLADDIWLLCVVHEEALNRKRSAALRFETVMLETEPLSGLIRITDVLISKVAR
ncbi:hypothetical protein LGM58_22580 [Burkholderia contaminans]|uniref:hypothetical protein n=1 Tax=Burkholderia contaminans TaxID=488447 RepID=UPI0015893620|nr:hypothetical protein [Burkholderia contaminans]MCA7885973.1 hypothetical protein [Burkholderia contaminans]HEM7878656.1 hypothetical protein [Burkholderia contaminans]